MLQIAIPNKGSLSEDAVELVREAGYRCRRDSRELVIRDPDNNVEFYFLRPRDIAVYVGKGLLDLGLTGRDLAQDSDAEVTELMALGFGKSSFRYAIPCEKDLTPDTFGGLRIATSYPKLVQTDMARRGQEVTIVKLDGAVEISIQLGVADAIADVVQTGRTLEEAGLKIVGDTVLRSEAVVVARDADFAADPDVRVFLDRLRGIIVAREFVMIEYDAPEALLEQASAITPGIESPTVSPLSKPGWVAVKSMASRVGINDVMDRLYGLGAKGIIVTDIRTCRI
ncbi:MAG: ATP phosphoribosyltransferase [Lentisphaeria bacterium]|jgi:ATP phosphoribosyltransferase|nr:ATP phosphoribosyltransferase [Lentisphaeria bacterium]